MFQEDRFNKILEIVNDLKSVNVTELSEMLGISESTVRRDLVTLDEQKKLKRVHGGATALKESGLSAKDFSVDIRAGLNVAEKSRIAKYAAKLVEKDDLVYIDAGSTTALLAQEITEKEALYVTNSFTLASILVKKGMRVFLPAGELKSTTEAIIGLQTVESLSRYRFTKGFFGTNGVTKEGYSTPDPTEAGVKEAAMKCCLEAYILADSTKIGVDSRVNFGRIKDATIITTELMDENLRNLTKIIEVY